MSSLRAIGIAETTDDMLKQHILPEKREFVNRPRTAEEIIVGTKTNGVGTDIIYFTAGGGGLNCTAITGTVLLEADNDVTTAAAPLYTATCLLRDTVRVRLESGYTLQNIIAGAVVRGTVNESLLPVGVADEGVRTPLTARMRFA